MKQVYLGSRGLEIREETRCGTSLCGHASSTTEELWRSSCFCFFWALALPFLTRPPSADLKIYKDVHRVHSLKCTQTVCFLSIQNAGPSEREREGNHFCRHNVHKCSQTSSVPAKNRRDAVGFFLSVTNLDWSILYIEKYMLLRG